MAKIRKKNNPRHFENKLPKYNFKSDSSKLNEIKNNDKQTLAR